MVYTDEIDLSGQESTVVDFSGSRPLLLRKGPVTSQDIKDALN